MHVVFLQGRYLPGCWVGVGNVAPRMAVDISPWFALGCGSSTLCARVWVLDGGHTAYVLRGFELSMTHASSPRALVAGLIPAENAGGGEEGALGTGA